MYASDAASRHLGIEIGGVEPGRATATMTVREDMVNGHGICHGGYVFTLADTAFAFACNTYDDRTVAVGATVDFRPRPQPQLRSAHAQRLARIRA